LNKSSLKRASPFGRFRRHTDRALVAAVLAVVSFRLCDASAVGAFRSSCSITRWRRDPVARLIQIRCSPPPRCCPTPSAAAASSPRAARLRQVRGVHHSNPSARTLSHFVAVGNHSIVQKTTRGEEARARPSRRKELKQPMIHFLTH
jgi:hypothetical protein